MSHYEAPLKLRVVERREVAANIVAFDLEAADYLPLPAFDAGAHIEIDCDGVARQYSLCSDPADPMRYRIAVQLETQGRGGSRFMCERVQVGDALDAAGPRNHFPMNVSQTSALLVSGGIGITPMLAMASTLYAAGTPFDMHDFASAAERQAFVDEIAHAPWCASVTRHLGACSDFGRLVGGFEAGRHLYVCGPFAMIDAVLDAARLRGWPEDHLHCERFAAPSPVSADTATQADIPFEVELASTGQRVSVALGQSVCAALADVGVHVPMSCEQGVCGSCITRVLDGVPDHRDWILSTEEQSSGKVFTPCCSRSKTPVLVLDL
ncbi:vanillate O-demethylase ferredoxin subunit [Paraburkholderia fungorum]|uniref:Vanillate O-demethylase ferredoxin subunit n=1 Tax=Paraburkholderia fungorum TaxID=134537 RepID=A0A1H1JN80_9BURK|nr:PDR/VanB family oxidoreductase [Paraburkholderia fungorum]SDR51125.1 vanillate O-demethylase ferredoxin subunit [Paraburkholderia fungorum]